MKKEMIFVLAVIFAVSSLCGAQNLVVNPGFETPEITGGGWPSSYGHWNGDYSSIVGASAGIVPLEASKMLKLSGSSHGGSGGSASACQVFQIINVSAYAEEISDGKVSVSASAYFNRIAGDSQTDTRFYVCIYAYAGEPSTFPTQWEPANSDHGILARANGFVYSDGDPATWEQGEAELALPTNTDFVVIGVNANEDIYNDYSLPEFDGHFADDVSAEVIIPVLVGLEITGPDEAAEDSVTSYKAMASYDNGWTRDVTDDAEWSVEPNVVASIEAGLLTTEKIFQPEELQIIAQYTEDSNTFDANKPVSVFAICPSGTALEFDGLDDYVNLGIEPDLQPSLPVTISAWVKLESLDEHKFIFSLDKELYWHSGIWLQVLNQRHLHIAYGDGGYSGPSSRRTKISTSVLDTGIWYHIVAVLVGPTDLTIYINGEDDGGVYSGSGGDLAYRNNESFIGTLSTDRHFFDGIIDEVAIYNRALSAQEIQMNMHVPLEGNEPNLVAYWDFDEGEGQVAHDTSGNGNDGQLGTGPDIDDSDPNWADSDAPVGICTLEQHLERNINDALEIKLNILDEILEALAREDASVNILDGLFGELEYGYLDKSDIGRARQEIHSAIQSEEQAIHSVEKSVGDLEDSLDILAGEDGPPDSNSPNDSRRIERFLIPLKK